MKRLDSELYRDFRERGILPSQVRTSWERLQEAQSGIHITSLMKIGIAMGFLALGFLGLGRPGYGFLWVESPKSLYA